MPRCKSPDTDTGTSPDKSANRTMKRPVFGGSLIRYVVDLYLSAKSDASLFPSSHSCSRFTLPSNGDADGGLLSAENVRHHRAVKLLPREVKNDDCAECVAWFRQSDKELRTIRLLGGWN